MGILWIYGPTGSGKTYEVQRLVKEKEMQGESVLVTTCEMLSARLLDLLRRRDKNAIASLEEYYSCVDTLVIEEMEGLLHKVATQEMVDELLIRLCGKGKCIICTSLCLPEKKSKLKTLPEFELLKLKWPNTEERRRIAEELCSELQLKLSKEETEDFVAKTKNAGQMKGALLQKKFCQINWQKFQRNLLGEKDEF